MTSREPLLCVEPGQVTVLAGPTAVGKGTVAADIRQRYPNIWLSTSCTTRPPRPGEIDGVHYHFVSAAKFDDMIERGELLEWAVVHGTHRYGTPKTPVAQAIAIGTPVLLEVDLAGARQIRQTVSGAHLVFLAPPSWDELVRRLLHRGTETADERARRLQTAKVELAAADEFDSVIVNSEVHVAADNLVSLMGLSTQPVNQEIS